MVVVANLSATNVFAQEEGAKLAPMKTVQPDESKLKVVPETPMVPAQPEGHWECRCVCVPVCCCHRRRCRVVYVQQCQKVFVPATTGDTVIK
jgi:hypothetical protein